MRGPASRHRVLGAGFRVLGVISVAALVSAHIGSPDVFFTGKVGRLTVSVVVRPPEVVPGVAKVVVRGPAEISRVTIRSVYWRAGSKGSPSADQMRLVSSTQSTGFTKVLEGRPMKTFEGSLWLMARGAYSVEVMVQGAMGSDSVLVPVASVATGRLALDTPLAAVLIALGVFLVTGLVNIVRKAAGESLLAPGKSLNEADVRASRVAGAIAVAVLVVAIFGGARWWNAVDGDYERSIYRPSPLRVSLVDGQLRLAARDTQYLPGGRLSTYVPDHGKRMHLFVVNDRGFAHLHPGADSSAVPEFTTMLPPLPGGSYRLYGDVVMETGFERTMVGQVLVPDKVPTQTPKLDADDGWFVGEPTRTGTMRLADGSVMSLAQGSAAPKAGEELALAVSVNDASGRPLAVEPYLGMAAHAVVWRTDGAVYVHLHPMGTVTMAAQEVFQARDRGDTTVSGQLRLSHGMMATRDAAATSLSSAVTFPYAFPRPGEYRVFVQVKRGGKVMTGAFAITVGDAPATTR